MLQGRHDFLFDMDQALAAYNELAGPKRLYLGDLGHCPAPKPVAEHPTYSRRSSPVVPGVPRAGPAVAGGVVLAHDPWNGKTSHFSGLPPTRHVSVNLPGTTTLLSPSASASRSVRLTGGPRRDVRRRLAHRELFDRRSGLLAPPGRGGVRARARRRR